MQKLQKISLISLIMCNMLYTMYCILHVSLDKNGVHWDAYPFRKSCLVFSIFELTWWQPGGGLSFNHCSGTEHRAPAPCCGHWWHLKTFGRLSFCQVLPILHWWGISQKILGRMAIHFPQKGTPLDTLEELAPPASKDRLEQLRSMGGNEAKLASQIEKEWMYRYVLRCHPLSCSDNLILTSKSSRPQRWTKKTRSCKQWNPYRGDVRRCQWIHFWDGLRPKPIEVLMLIG